MSKLAEAQAIIAAATATQTQDGAPAPTAATPTPVPAPAPVAAVTPAAQPAPAPAAKVEAATAAIPSEPAPAPADWEAERRRLESIAKSDQGVVKAQGRELRELRAAKAAADAKLAELQRRLEETQLARETAASTRTAQEASDPAAADGDDGLAFLPDETRVVVKRKFTEQEQRLQQITEELASLRAGRFLDDIAAAPAERQLLMDPRWAKWVEKPTVAPVYKQAMATQNVALMKAIMRDCADAMRPATSTEPTTPPRPSLSELATPAPAGTYAADKPLASLPATAKTYTPAELQQLMDTHQNQRRRGDPKADATYNEMIAAVREGRVTG